MTQATSNYLQEAYSSFSPQDNASWRKSDSYDRKIIESILNQGSHEQAVSCGPNKQQYVAQFGDAEWEPLKKSTPRESVECCFTEQSDFEAMRSDRE
jgi:hypothetical protein